MNPRPRLSVVIPTRNGAATLAACLQSLRSSSLVPHEIIVVDDASSDDSATIAESQGCRVLRLPENIGAARAKNRGASAATGDWVYFTDDDVIATPQALAQVAEDLQTDGITGVVGVLAGEIPFGNFASNYKNLWMRFTYRRLTGGRERIGVFYTSVAAIRRDTFLQLGGFDENYAGASIAEDTEFGQRAWAAGHTLILDPRVMVTHCKHYTLAQVYRTDFLRARALMLMRLRKWGQAFYTSVPVFYRLAVPVIYGAALFGALAMLFPGVLTVAGAVVLGALFYALNAPWLGYLTRERGAGFALRAALVQPLDVLAVGAGMAVAVLDFARGLRY